jgi:hypothetical protein
MFTKMLAPVFSQAWLVVCQLTYMELNQLFSKHLAVCSTIELRTNHSYQVSLVMLNIIDSIKWAIR